MENLIPRVKVSDVVTVVVIIAGIALFQKKVMKLPVIGDYLPGA
jgi:hypothetical protein